MIEWKPELWWWGFCCCWIALLLSEITLHVTFLWDGLSLQGPNYFFELLSTTLQSECMSVWEFTVGIAKTVFHRNWSWSCTSDSLVSWGKKVRQLIQVSSGLICVLLEMKCPRILTFMFILFNSLSGIYYSLVRHTFWYSFIDCFSFFFFSKMLKKLGKNI